MVFEVHRARRADVLAEGLADLLATPLPDPFATELVLVPARGVERWLSQRLSHRLGPSEGRNDGVCAGVEFRSPASLVAELTGSLDDDPWAPDALVWPLLSVVDASAGEAWCRTLSEHLGHGREGEEAELRRGRRYAVARRLARLLGSYAAQRPRLLEDWSAGRDTDGAGGALAGDLLWQAELWRRVTVEVDAPTPAERAAAVAERLRSDPEAFQLPSRVSLFGHTRLPAAEIALLESLAERRGVHLWLPHPSPALWSALAPTRGVVRRAEDNSHLLAAHPLLASLGRDLRELQRRLPPGGEAMTDPIPPDTLLGMLQCDLAANAVPATPRTVALADDSVSVHACHGPARQVEVLREVLVGLLADDPTLEPRDIVVMCPDIEAYAPLISAAFGLGDVLPHSHPGQRMRVRLADRALTQTNPLLAVAAALLDLAGGRAEASRVLDLLTTPPVRRRFGLSDSHLERITHWVDAAGVRWAFDAEHRAPYSLSGYLQNTWRFGLDRVLAGVAASEDAGRWFGTTLPLDDVASTDIDLVGRLAEVLDRLQRATDALTGTHPVEHWLSALEEGIAGLTAVGWGEEWQTGQVQRELAAIGSAASQQTELRLADVRALVSERFAGRPTRANFRTGTLTVCTLVPMRSVPHRVVALLGLDDGIFPRASNVDGDDVLARDPLTGERDPRSEDRQLLLDAVMAASEHLVVCYTGANESTGQPRPPAVPVKELLDALDLTAAGGAEHALHRHPLQAFDPRNLGAAGAPFSFDAAALAGARAAVRERRALPGLAEVRLETGMSGDVELADLVAFVKAPVKQFLRRRLGLTLADDAEETADAIPVELDSLEEWQVGDRVLRDLLAGRTPDDALGLEWRRGGLPPGKLGWSLARRIRDDAGPVAEMVEASVAGAQADAVDVDLELPDGRRLVGTVTDVYDRRVVKAGFSRLGPKSELDAWVSLVALEAALPGRGWSAGAVGRGRKGDPPARVVFAGVGDARAALADLVALYDAGMRGPLPLPVKTARAWAERRSRGNDVACRYAADDQWAAQKFPGEQAEPAHVLVWGPAAPIDVLLGPPLAGEELDGETTRLGALALRLWRPIMAAGVRT